MSEGCIEIQLFEYKIGIKGNFGILPGTMNMQLFATHYQIIMQFQILIQSQYLYICVKERCLKINGAYK